MATTAFPNPDEASGPMKIDVWSDIACPWCWVGKRHLETAIEGLDVEVEWHPFELDPRERPTPESVDYVERLASKYGMSPGEAQGFIDRMTAAGAAQGAEIRFDRIRPANTFNAHRLLAWAHEAGKQDALKERLFVAYMNEGQDVNDAATLTSLCADVGLDAADAARVLASDRYADAVREGLAQASAHGVRGVPYFRFASGAGLSGAHPPDALRRALLAQ